MSTKLLPIHTNFKSPSPKPCFPPSIPSHFLPFSSKNPQISSPCSFFLYRKTSKISTLLSSSPLHNPTPSSEGQSHHLALTQEAICDFLLELEIPQEDAFFISSHSPNYAQMLNDSVRDLEEWNSWSNNSNVDAGDSKEVSFREKVITMAKEKGDNGKVAFLESIGLNLSSAIGVARYLSGESLPTLVHKVKYMKEIFFSGSVPEGLVGKNARRMMRHISITTDEDLQQTLSFFEKIEARRGGLSMLGSTDASFRYLVESFPRLLLLSIDTHLKPLVEFLENIGIPNGCKGSILLIFPPIMMLGINKMRTRMRIFEEAGAVDKDAGKMLLKYPWILSKSIQENYKEILSLFDELKVSREGVNRAVRSWPHLLGCSTSNLKLMVEELDELGVRDNKLSKVIAKSPQLLLRRPQEFLQVVSFLEDLGLDREKVQRILVRCPELFTISIDKTLSTKIKFLAGIGVSEDHLARVINKYPELLFLDVERTLLPRVKYLMGMGFSKRDIVFMVRRFSPLLGYSINEVLRPKMEFLLNTMERPLRDAVDYPRYFSYSLEKRIKPRFWVVKGRNIECSLKDMLGKNDEEFAAEFMSAGVGLLPPLPSQK